MRGARTQRQPEAERLPTPTPRGWDFPVSWQARMEESVRRICKEPPPPSPEARLGAGSWEEREAAGQKRI